MLSLRHISTAAASSSTRRALSSVAATTITDDIPTYITEAPTPQITKLDNGVVVASLFNAE